MVPRIYEVKITERGTLYPAGDRQHIGRMPDEADPPRKFYGFKPAEFDRANALPPSRTEPPKPDPGIAATGAGKIDVHELVRAGAGAGSQLGSNKVRNRENEVHALLQGNYLAGKRSGDFDLGALDDSKRRRRIRNYWIGFVLVNLPLGLFAWRIGPGAAIPFVCTIAAMGMITALLTWQTFFLRTHY